MITSSGVCGGSAISNSATLTVQENPVIDTPPVGQTVCEGGTIQLSVAAHGTGLSYQWYQDGNPLGGQVAATLTILNATAANAGAYHVVVSGTCNPAGVASAPVNVVVDEAPEVVAHPSNQTICEGTNTTMSVDAGVTASAIYQWQVNRNDGAGFVDLTADGVHQDINTATLSINGAPLSHNGYLYRAVITSSGVCTGSSISNAAILTVRELPVIDVGLTDASRCRGESVTFSVEARGTGLTYQWQKDGTDIGGPTTLPQLTLSSVTVADAGVYTVIVSGACTPSVSSSAVLTVQELPVVTNTHEQLTIEICSGESLTFVPTFSIPGTTFTWESQQSAQITGGVTVNGSDFTTQTPVNNTSVPGIITYKVTPRFNGCDGPSFNFVVTVKPLPTAYADDKTICSGNDTNITLTPAPKNVAGTTFDWVATPSNVTGAADGNGTLLNQNLVTDVNGGSVTYAVRPMANGCFGPIHNVVVTVNPIPVVDAGVDFSVCEPATVTLTGTIGGSAALGTWTADPAASGSLSGSSVSGTTVTATYTVSPADLNKTFSFFLASDDPDDVGGPCIAAVDEVRVTIHELPEVALSELKPEYAENDPVQTLAGFPTANGVGVFSGPGIIGTSNQFNPDFADIGPNLITYTFTSSITGCTNSDSKITIVNPVTDIDFDIGENPRRAVNGDLLICQNLADQPMNGYPAPSTALAASFASEDGKLSSTDLFPGPGGQWFLKTDGLLPDEYLISYSYTNSLGATEVKTKKLVVFEAPTAVIDMQAVCTDSDVVFNHLSFQPADGAPFTYFWSFGENGEVSSAENPQYSYQTPGPKTVTLRVTTSTGCSHTDTDLVTVGQPPVVTFEYSKRCSEVQATEFVDTTPASPFYNIVRYTWDFGDGNTVIDGDAGTSIPAGTHAGSTTGIYDDPIHRYSAFGTYPVTMTVTTAEGCEASVQRNAYILDYNIPDPTTAYMVDFESGPAGWVDIPPDEGEKSWLLGTPFGNVINSASSGSNAWWTGGNPDVADANSFYFRNENSEVLGPCLDLSALKRPMISLRYWSDTPLGYDGAVLQYSTNSGVTWTTVGTAEGQGIEWYNARNMASNPGGQDNHAWSDTTLGWRTARFSLDEINPLERSLVLFRIAFSSTEKGRGGSRPMEGFAFDDIYIGEKKRNVLVENFTNAVDAASLPGRTWFNNEYDQQMAARDSADFIVIQYHLANPVFDQLNADNEVDPFSRAQWYGVANPPAAVMDGIQGTYFGKNFDGTYSRIDASELDRRSLEDPLFNINIMLDNTANGPLTGEVDLAYTGTVAYPNPVLLHAALVEDGIGGNNRNVLRKFIWGPQGKRLEGPVAVGNQFNDIAINFDMNAIVTNPSNLYLIVFVQDKVTKRVLQSRIVKAPSKESVIVGVEDPNVSVLRDLNVYPNPASKVIKFSLDKILSHQYSWRIIDQRGVTVADGSLNTDLRDPQEVDISNLANGIYFLAIQTGDRAVLYRKIAIMNR